MGAEGRTEPRDTPDAKVTLSLQHFVRGDTERAGGTTTNARADNNEVTTTDSTPTGPEPGRPDFHFVT